MSGGFDRNRRLVLGAGLACGAGMIGAKASAGIPGLLDQVIDALLPAAKSAQVPGALSGYEMPSESVPHERTFMQWPVSREVYDRQSLRKVQSRIALIANTISRFEPVVMLASEVHAKAARKLLNHQVDVWEIPTEDLWCRDSGPIFVKNAAGKLAVAHIQFNGWGNKQVHKLDGRIAERVASRLGLPLVATGLVGEGGGVEHDGAGTLLATASCWVNDNRNRGDQAEIGQLLLGALGGKKMLWTPGLKGADITDFHIDALARFVEPGKLLIQLPETADPDDPFSRAAFETYEILKRQSDAHGRKLEIVVIPEPTRTRSRNDDFLASYVNYYVCNRAVICAEFGDARTDRKAQDVLASLYPGRRIVSLNIDALGEAGGGIHCATQQQPRAGRV